MQITALMRDSVARSLAGLMAKGRLLKRMGVQAEAEDGMIAEQIICSIIDDIARLLEEEKKRGSWSRDKRERP